MDIGGHLEYAKANRERLDAKITELRAEGWDVVARRERDLALSERDDARDDLEGAVEERDRLLQDVADLERANRDLNRRLQAALASPLTRGQ